MLAEETRGRLKDAIALFVGDFEHFAVATRVAVGVNGLVISNIQDFSDSPDFFGAETVRCREISGENAVFAFKPGRDDFDAVLFAPEFEIIGK